MLNVVSNPLQGSSINLQGNSPNLQGNSYGPTLSNPAIGSTTNSSATSPTNPKQQYIQTQAQNLQSPVQTQNPATTTYNSQYGLGFGNGSSFNANGIQTQAPTAPQYSPTGFNATSGANGTGVYDPYNSPAYQQYLNQSIQAQQPALNNQQIQTGLVGANTGLQNLQSIYSGNISADLNNPSLSQGALTGQEAAQAQVLANESVPYQTQINLLNQQQQQATAAATTGLTAANTQAGYLAGFSNPQTLSPGQTSISANPQTGQAQTLGSVGSYSFGTGIAGQPISQSQTTGAINSGGTNAGLGATPPTLGQSGSESSALQSVAQTYGLTDPASQLALQSAVQQTLASNGDVNAAGVPANMQNAVKAVLSQMSGGTYSPGNASINQANLTVEQATANDLIAPAQTATEHLSDLQSLANAVGYTNSPIASNIRNQFSGSILTDPSVTTLQSAIGVVRAEVAKVLGGGTPTVASQAEAASALPDNLSPQNIAGVIANVQKLMNDKVQSYSNPANAASLPTGLSMPAGYSASIPVGSLTINPNSP